MTIRDPVVEALARHDGNGPVLEHLRARAEPARTEYRLGPWEQHVHPDVCERLDEVDRAGTAVGVYGHCARMVRGGLLYAIGLGTGTIALRLPSGPEREAVLAHGGTSGPAFGSDWDLADAWLSNVPRADGTNLLAAWVAAARGAASA
jgi:hypothetical protein